MPKTIIAEGKTTNEAIENGLKELKVSKDKVEIKVLENQEKRSFFSILAPRLVKVELTLKENEHKHQERKAESPRKEISMEDVEKAKASVQEFLNDFLRNFENTKYEIKIEKEFLSVEITGEGSAKLIGYRGETLNSLQTIINSVANKSSDSKVRVILNVGNYKEKREKALEELADKISKTVIKTGKSITLEPMVAYERKIIHNRLQQNSKVRTYSIGDEPYRKVVIEKNK